MAEYLQKGEFKEGYRKRFVACMELVARYGDYYDVKNIKDLCSKIGCPHPAFTRLKIKDTGIGPNKILEYTEKLAKDYHININYVLNDSRPESFDEKLKNVLNDSGEHYGGYNINVQRQLDFLEHIITEQKNLLKQKDEMIAQQMKMIETVTKRLATTHN
ncbi:MAG TPA: hypothetical protein PL045_06395 [Chitinophagaceae bacterium]|nr:hypothetical protein [Chitinophagaceae bacterium]